MADPAPLFQQVLEIASRPEGSEQRLADLVRQHAAAALLDAAEKLVDDGARRTFLAAAAGRYRSAGRAVDAVRCLQRCVELATTPADAERVWMDLVAAYESTDRLEDATEACRSAIEAAQSAGAPDREARHANRLGTLLHQRGDKDGARAAYERSLALREGQPPDRARVNALLNLATLLRESGDPRRARERASEAAGAAASVDVSRVAAAEALAAHAALESDDLDGAAKARARAQERFRADGDRAGECDLLLEQASILLRRGKADLARTLLDLVPSPVPDGARTRFEALRAKLQTAPAAPDRRGRLFARVNDLLAAILVRRDPRALLREVVDAAVDLLGAERGFCLLNVDGEVEVFVARNLDKESVQGAEFKISRHIADRAAKQGIPLLTAQAARDPSLAGVASIEQKQIQSVCCVPLRVGERILGALYLDNRMREAAFSAEDLEALETLARPAAVALLHAQLHEENARVQKELERANAQLRLTNQQLRVRVEEATRQLKRVKEELSGREQYGELVGQGRAMQELFRVLERIEPSDEPVLITGESGTGKELLARAVHAHSPRKGGPFVSINCAAVPETLLESELFGHMKGSFTGATGDRAGLFEEAKDGTIFLDEIGEMPPAMQSKLLRVLQEKEVRRVGGSGVRKVNARVITATNRVLRERIKSGEFREDLFYRINVIHLNLPPLRERREDIPVLARHLWEKIQKAAGKDPTPLDEGALARLAAHDWPGNVRELENELRRVQALGGAAPLTDTRVTPRKVAPADLRSLEEVELEHIRLVLSSTGNNVTQAARVLGIGVATLWRWIKKHKIAT